MHDHKKKNSLIPLNFDYTTRSDQEEGVLAGSISNGTSCISSTLPPSPSVPMYRSSSKASTRAKSPELRSICSCNVTGPPPSGRQPTNGNLPAQPRNGLHASPNGSFSDKNPRLPLTTAAPFSRPHVVDTVETNNNVEEATAATTTTIETLDASSFSDILFSVDGHRALVTFDPENGLIVRYTNRRGCLATCAEREAFRVEEILSAEILPPRNDKILWKAFKQRTFRMAIYTFRRAYDSPSHWYPRRIVLSTPTVGLVELWAAAMSQAIRLAGPRRPRRLLVLVNPFGGKRQAMKLYSHVVGPVFHRAAIDVDVRETQFGGHARALLLDMPAVELKSFDGVVAVGGDGLFHEIVNALLHLRAQASTTAASTNTGTTRNSSINGMMMQEDHHRCEIEEERSEYVGGEHPRRALFPQDALSDAHIHNASTSTSTNEADARTNNYASRPSSTHAPTSSGAEVLARAAAAINLRVGHIPAGSTDAVACTLNGTRSAFSAAMRIALGDGIPLDVVRIDARDGSSRFAVSMASYGFMGDLMEESEGYRWMGPLRYEIIGAKMLAANRSYRCRISYLPATETQPDSFTKPCGIRCDVCASSSSPPSRTSAHLVNGTGDEATNAFSSSSAAAAAVSASSLGAGGVAGSNVNDGTSSPKGSPPFSELPGDRELREKNGVGAPDAPAGMPLMTPSAVAFPVANAQEQPQARSSGEQDADTSYNDARSHDARINNASRVAPTPSPWMKVPKEPFAQHSHRCVLHRSAEWKTVQGEFAGIMLVIMPCRSDKSLRGVARYGHLSDGNIHLVMVRKCSRLRYLRFLLAMSAGLAAGKAPDGMVEVVPAVAVKVESMVGSTNSGTSTGTGYGIGEEVDTSRQQQHQQACNGINNNNKRQESVWNVDGELLRCTGITAETHRGAIEVFARGIETEAEIRRAELDSYGVFSKGWFF